MAVGSQFRSAAILLSSCVPSVAGPTTDDRPDLCLESDSCYAGTSCRISPAVRTLLNFAMLLLCRTLAFFRSHREQAIVELARRQQLATYAQTRPKPRLTPLDRAFWLALYRFWPGWKDALVIVKPGTAIRWHRKEFQLYERPLVRHAAHAPVSRYRGPYHIGEVYARSWIHQGPWIPLASRPRASASKTECRGVGISSTRT